MKFAPGIFLFLAWEAKKAAGEAVVGINTHGAVIWEGPSRLDPSKMVVVVVTGLGGSPSRNTKTGKMVQTWILSRDAHPGELVKTGPQAVKAHCGSCPFAARCYVRIDGPASVWKSVQGKAEVATRRATGRNFIKQFRPYPRLTPFAAGLLTKGRAVRLGAYGDPAAVPAQVWRDLLSGAQAAGTRRWTGYTHSWNLLPAGEGWQGLVMASVETPSGYAKAKALGYRTFRVVLDVADRTASEVLCPASKEAGFKSTCAACGLCNGTRTGDVRKDIVIVLHGNARTVKEMRRIIEDLLAKEAFVLA